MKKCSVINGGVAYDIEGKAHYLGVYEYEGREMPTYDEFVTIGSKKYAYDKNGVITTTISGVSKDKGGEELYKKGGLERLSNSMFEDDDDYEEMVFTESAGLVLKYNDSVNYEEVIDNHKVRITRNIYTYDNTYGVSISKQYEMILKKLKEI